MWRNPERADETHGFCIGCGCASLHWLIQSFKRYGPIRGLWNSWPLECIHLVREPDRKGRNVDDSLKQLMHDLGNAINDSLSESDRIAEAIGEIRRNGYDVFLVLEATIGFNRREESESGDTNVSEDSDGKTSRVATGNVKFTAQDERFLKMLKITVED